MAILHLEVETDDYAKIVADGIKDAQTRGDFDFTVNVVIDYDNEE